MGKCCKCVNGKKAVFIKGGRKKGLFNGDITKGTYIDINGNFITPDGFAIDEEGKVLLDENNKPITGDIPSYIDIEDFTYKGVPWVSKYDIDKLGKINIRHPYLDMKYDELLITSYFDLFDIKLDVPDELILAPDAMFECWQRYKHAAKTVQINWTDILKNKG